MDSYYNYIDCVSLKFIQIFLARDYINTWSSRDDGTTIYSMKMKWVTALEYSW